MNACFTTKKLHPPLACRDGSDRKLALFENSPMPRRNGIHMRHGRSEIFYVDVVHPNKLRRRPPVHAHSYIWKTRQDPERKCVRTIRDVQIANGAPSRLSDMPPLERRPNHWFE